MMIFGNKKTCKLELAGLDFSFEKKEIKVI